MLKISSQYHFWFKRYKNQPKTIKKRVFYRPERVLTQNFIFVDEILHSYTVPNFKSKGLVVLEILGGGCTTPPPLYAPPNV